MVRGNNEKLVNSMPERTSAVTEICEKPSTKNQQQLISDTPFKEKKACDNHNAIKFNIFLSKEIQPLLVLVK